MCSTLILCSGIIYFPKLVCLIHFWACQLWCFWIIKSVYKMCKGNSHIFLVTWIRWKFIPSNCPIVLPIDYILDMSQYTTDNGHSTPHHTSLYHTYNNWNVTTINYQLIPVGVYMRQSVGQMTTGWPLNIYGTDNNETTK